jgi:hypothetical protein
MIDALPGWSWERRGESTILAPTEDRGAGRIHYLERNRPLRRVSDLVTEFEKDWRFRITQVGQPERLTTNEGEPAVIVTIDGLLLEAPVQRTVGYVVTDDFYSRIDGLAFQSEAYGRIARTVRTLTQTDTFALGYVRRRRFYYEPPSGWHGLASTTLHTYFYPIDYPRNRSTITVAPAYPMPTGTPEFLKVIPDLQIEPGSVFVIEQKTETGSVKNRHSLTGISWEISGRYSTTEVLRDVVVLEDARFIYAVYLESPREHRERNMAILTAIIDSIEPVPRQGEAKQKEGRESLDHWAE